MAKAIVCTQVPSNKGTFAVTIVYPDGTDITKVPSPSTGSLLLPATDGNVWSVGDTVSPDVICSGLAVILATISTINWTQVKAAIN